MQVSINGWEAKHDVGLKSLSSQPQESKTEGSDVTWRSVTSVLAMSVPRRTSHAVLVPRSKVPCAAPGHWLVPDRARPFREQVTLGAEVFFSRVDIK